LSGLLFFLPFPPTATSDAAGEEVEGEDAEAGGGEDKLAVSVVILVHLTRGSLADRGAEGKGGLGERAGGGNSSAMGVERGACEEGKEMPPKG
jgi:hypothetical protein